MSFITTQRPRHGPRPEGTDHALDVSARRQAEGVISAERLTACRRPEDKRRLPEHPTGLDAAWQYVASNLTCLYPRRRAALRMADAVLKQIKSIESEGSRALDARLSDLRAHYRRGRIHRTTQTHALAAVAEAARRATGLTPYRVQLAGAAAIGWGQLAEMATGEGKTLTAAIAAVPVAWRGRGCHVVTVNDYLAGRDADWGRDMFKCCGLTVAAVHGEATPEERQKAYAKDITYATNKELAADFLRDRLQIGRGRGSTEQLIDRLALGGGPVSTTCTMMRGLHFAIVDEADSVLIDEAVTPLILSAESGDEARKEAYRVAAELATQLRAGAHYRVDHRHRDVRLTGRGRNLAGKLTEGLGGPWRVMRVRDELVKMALTAKEHFLNDREYVVQDGKAVIVDPSTGRQMPDRSWRHGLHQAVEAKENIEITPNKETLARVSFQRFFRMYRHLSGLTGTAWEVRQEVWRTYRLHTVRIPRNRPLAVRRRRQRIFATASAKHAGIADLIQSCHDRGQPVLVGTASVEESEQISNLLTERGVSHRMLSALHHHEEAQVVAKAGALGAVTVATNMAGRGTDIRLSQQVLDLGGLHVIAATRNIATRVDRQLAGRCARQGQPGIVSVFVSLEDDLPKRYLPKSLQQATRRLKPIVGGRMVDLAQKRCERSNRRQRAMVLKSDDQLDQQLGFAKDFA